jgi:proton-dependent oligopeptide transporter, POT family
MGELCISPVGLSYVSKLSPPRLVGLMFGIWFVANFIANNLAGFTGSFIDSITEKYSLTVFFLIFTIMPILAGLVMLGLSKMLQKKMHGVH